MKAHPGINILSDNQNAMASRHGGFAVGQNLLARFPHVDAAFCINDQTAIGLALAANQQSRHGLFITSVDGAPDIVREIKNKNEMIKASTAQDPCGMAAAAYSYAVDVVSGKVPPAKVIRLSPTLITIDNVDSHEGRNLNRVQFEKHGFRGLGFPPPEVTRSSPAFLCHAAR